MGLTRAHVGISRCLGYPSCLSERSVLEPGLLEKRDCPGKKKKNKDEPGLHHRASGPSVSISRPSRRGKRQPTTTPGWRSSVTPSSGNAASCSCRSTASKPVPPDPRPAFLLSHGQTGPGHLHGKQTPHSSAGGTFPLRATPGTWT